MHIQEGLWNSRASVCPSVCLSVPSFGLSSTARRCGGFTAVGPAGGKYRSTAAWPGPEQQMRAVSADVGSWRETCWCGGCCWRETCCCDGCFGRVQQQQERALRGRCCLCWSWWRCSWTTCARPTTATPRWSTSSSRTSCASWWTSVCRFTASHAA